jgi:hypothetical protein
MFPAVGPTTSRLRGAAGSGNNDASFFNSTNDSAGTIDDRVRDRRVSHALRRIEEPELELRRQQTSQRRVDLGFGDQTIVHRDQEIVECATAVQIASIANRERGRLRGVGGDFVMLMEIVDRAAVAHHVTGKAPAFAKDFLQQKMTATRRLSEHAIVRAHHRFDTATHELLERRQIRLLKIARCGMRIKTVTLVLGS